MCVSPYKGLNHSKCHPRLPAKQQRQGLADISKVEAERLHHSKCHQRQAVRQQRQGLADISIEIWVALAADTGGFNTVCTLYNK